MGKKIMVIDDDANIVKYLSDLFVDNGYEVCTSYDGRGAMDILKKEKPDLITLDIEMPEEWGPRFYRHLTKEEEFKKVPVIVISGLTGTKYSIPKAVAVINKPFNQDELLKTVKDTIG